MIPSYYITLAIYGRKDTLWALIWSMRLPLGWKHVR